MMGALLSHSRGFMRMLDLLCSLHQRSYVDATLRMLSEKGRAVERAREVVK